MFIVSTSAGRSLGLARAASAIERSTASRLSGWPASMTTSSSSTSALDQGHLGARRRRGDLVAPHVDVEQGERPLHRPQQLVAGAEQGDHRDLRRDHDDVGRRAAPPAASWAGLDVASVLQSCRDAQSTGALSRAATSWPAAEHVHVGVEDRLPGVRPGVDDHPVALPSSPSAGPRRRRRAARRPAPPGPPRRAPRRRAGAAGDDQHVRRRLRVDVAEGQRGPRLVDDRRPGSRAPRSGRTGSRSRRRSLMKRA